MEQYTKEIMRTHMKPKKYSPVIVDGIDDTWGLDLADMAEWHESNDGYKYILVIVDCFNRYAWCKPLRSKNAVEGWDAIQSVLNEHKPKYIWVDRGTEFYNKIWTEKLKELRIGRYSTNSDVGVSIAERFIRTLKHKIWFHFVLKGARKWIDILDALVHEYNNTIHSAIGMTPADAREPSNEYALLDRVHSPKKGKPKYKLGDWVRIHRLKGRFGKGFHGNFSYEIYRIVGIRKSEPVMYYLQDYFGELIDGGFYDNDLTPVADPSFFPIETVLDRRVYKRQPQMLVKYLGYKEPKWIADKFVNSL